jgi:hypothetical protein
MTGTAAWFTKKAFLSQYMNVSGCKYKCTKNWIVLLMGTCVPNMATDVLIRPSGKIQIKVLHVTRNSSLE